jgi:hypothetical protein
LRFAEAFHFVEYGLLAYLFYRVWQTSDDGSALVLPFLAGIVVGSLDEWFQWFIPIRAGEARDIGIDCLATIAGLLFATATVPPSIQLLTVRLEDRKRLRLWLAGAGLAFAGFFAVVHMGFEIADPDVGTFRSHFSPTGLERAARDRLARWSAQPPLIQSRLSREDQYLSEGLWRVRRRNDAWNMGDLDTAWHENRILEKFYQPVLDAPTYAGASGQRWSVVQREDAQARATEPDSRYTTAEYAYPLYVWPHLFPR